MNIRFFKRNRPAVLLSDKFRSVRFALRNLKNTIDEYEDYDKRAIPLIGTVSALANASDSALSNVEEKLHHHFSSDAKKHFGQATACSLYLYIGSAGSGESFRDKSGLQFAGDQYFTAKRVALAFGVDNILLHQSRFLYTWRDFRRTLDDLELADTGSCEEVCDALPGLCASYAALLRRNAIVVFPARHQLLRQVREGAAELADGKTVETNIFLPATIALITAVASYCDAQGIKKSADAIYDNCVSLIDARYDSIAEIFESPHFHEKFEEFLVNWTPRLA